MEKTVHSALASPSRASSHRWQNWLVAGVALWLLCSPELIPLFSATSHAGGRNDPAIWNAWLTGFLGLIMAAMALIASRPWPSFLILVLATWLAVSPWELGYEHLPFWTWNAILTGCAWGISEGSVLLNRYGLIPQLSSSGAEHARAQPGLKGQLQRLTGRLASLLKSIRSASTGTDRLRPGR